MPARYRGLPDGGGAVRLTWRSYVHRRFGAAFSAAFGIGEAAGVYVCIADADNQLMRDGSLRGDHEGDSAELGVTLKSHRVER
jgi:hypothetical protein